MFLSSKTNHLKERTEQNVKRAKEGLIYSSVPFSIQSVKNNDVNLLPTKFDKEEKYVNVLLVLDEVIFGKDYIKVGDHVMWNYIASFL